MADLAIAALLALGFLAVLAASGRLRFVADEMPSRARQSGALAVLWVALVVCVFYPTVAPGDAAAVDPETLWFPSIFSGQLILAGFLLVWWMLSRQVPPRRFLRLEHGSADDIFFGLRVGAFGWLCAIAASAVTLLILLALGHSPTGGAESAAQPFEVPPLLLWLVNLPIWRKLVVVAIAMTVEEAFYRAFLQTRLGWLLSSGLFALSHGGYGLPTLTASVFAVSLVIGWALRARGTLLPCIVAHGVFDAIQLLVVMPLAIRHLPSVA
jgi:membrane protease YdiL (CAAX protease family)